MERLKLVGMWASFRVFEVQTHVNKGSKQPNKRTSNKYSVYCKNYTFQLRSPPAQTRDSVVRYVKAALPDEKLDIGCHH